MDPWRTLCFQSGRLDFEDIWIVIYNMHRRPEMGEKECNLKKNEQKMELTFLNHPLRVGSTILFCFAFS